MAEKQEIWSVRGTFEDGNPLGLTVLEYKGGAVKDLETSLESTEETLAGWKERMGENIGKTLPFLHTTKKR